MDPIRQLGQQIDGVYFFCKYLSGHRKDRQDLVLKRLGGIIFFGRNGCIREMGRPCGRWRMSEKPL